MKRSHFKYAGAAALLCTVALGCDSTGGKAGGPGAVEKTDAATDQGEAQVCKSDGDCRDGRFCNGTERCDPDHPDASALGCVPGAPPCGEGTRCDEEAEVCTSAAGGDGTADAGAGEGDASADGSTVQADAAADAAGSAPDAAGPPGTLGCKAGYYAGGLTGAYFPSISVVINGGGIAGGLLQAQVLAPLTETLGVGLSLTPRAGDASILELTGGCVVGTLVDNYIQAQDPFIAVMTGELDCQTGVLSGTLRGHYTIFGTSDPWYSFEGPLAGHLVGGARVDGTWDVREDSDAATPPGGSGEWSVSWAADAASAPTLPAECQALLDAAP